MRLKWEDEDDLPVLGASSLRLAAMKTLSTLDLSSGWRKVSLEEGQIHPGDDPIEADKEAHETFRRTFEMHPAVPLLDVKGIIGEENLVNPPKLKPGERLVVVDPIDGSSQWALIRSGYCVAALMLVADDRGRTHFESAVIATPVHTFTIVGNDLPTFGPTYGQSDEYVTLASCLPESEVAEAPSFSFTGYKPKDRGSVLALIRHMPGWSFLTIGGNPVTPYVVAATLTGAVTLRAQTTWDAIGILLASRTDAVVGDLDGNVVSGASFQSLFDNIDIHDVRVIPPMVVAKNEARFADLVEGVNRARDEFGEAFGSGREDLIPPAGEPAPSKEG